MQKWDIEVNEFGLAAGTATNEENQEGTAPVEAAIAELAIQQEGRTAVHEFHSYELNF